MDRANAGKQIRIAKRMRAWVALKPSLKAARRDFEQPRHGRNGLGGLIRFHDLEPFSGTVTVSRANQAAAFDKMSRSSSSWRTLRRSRVSSSRSAVVKPS